MFKLMKDWQETFHIHIKKNELYVQLQSKMYKGKTSLPELGMFLFMLTKHDVIVK